MFKKQNGITLIALVITIIVLLILAGVTIAMLTGSDSAPQKANEAKQKQDIGTAKDQVYIWAQDAQMTAYENVYVNGKMASGSGDLPTSKSGKNTNIGSYVGTQVGGKSKTKIGLATIETKAEDKKVSLDSTKTSEQDKTTDTTAEITITTTDFTLTGYINKVTGTLEWVDNGTIKDKTN